MRVNIFTSVTAKLFYYMTALVVATLAGNAFQFSKMFIDHEQEQIKDSIVSDAEQARTEFTKSVDTWKSQISVALPALRGVAKKQADAQFSNFVDSNKEFVSFEIFETSEQGSANLKSVQKAFTSNSKDRRWNGKEHKSYLPSIRKAVLRQLKNDLPGIKSPSQVIFTSIAKPTRLPLVMLATQFRIKGSNTIIWAVLTAWQTNLVEVLPKSKFVASRVIDNKGKVFSSHTYMEMINNRRLPRANLVGSALSSPTPSGFQDEYRSNNRRTLGGFAKIPGYNLTVLIERDAEKVYEALQKNLIATGLWALLFVLFAVLFAFVGAAGITSRLRAVTQATASIAAGDFGVRLIPRSRDEVGVLSHSINVMSAKITDLLMSQIDKARFEKELETARIVQSTFFPKTDIQSKHLKLSGFYQPASECGGDLWGHFNIREGVDFVYIADATGHGAPAALVTAIAYSTARTIGDMLKGEAEVSPAAILQRINKIIFEAVEGDICMTFFGAIIDTNSGILTYANAGHNFPILLPKDANDDRGKRVPKSIKKITDIKPVSLTKGGAPLGLAGDTTFKDTSLPLREGDKIFFFTDGLIECQSPQNTVWGRRVLIENIAENVKSDATTLKDEILSRAFSFFQNRPIDDDVTVVVAQLDDQWSPVAVVDTSDSTTKAPPPPPLPFTMDYQTPEEVAPLPTDLPQTKETLEGEAVFLEAHEAEEQREGLEKIGIEEESTSNDTEKAVDFSLEIEMAPETAMVSEKPLAAEESAASREYDDGSELDRKSRRKNKFKIKLPSAG